LAGLHCFAFACQPRFRFSALLLPQPNHNLVTDHPSFAICRLHTQALAFQLPPFQEWGMEDVETWNFVDSESIKMASGSPELAHHRIKR
jgi:hypothetical protein